jgi:hypothetical protein
MRITVEFDNEDEFEAFKTSGKKTRTKKGDDEQTATPPQHTTATVNVPAPMAIPTATQFNPQATSTTFPQGGAFPSTAPAGLAQEIMKVVNEVAAKLDSTIAGGSPAEPALAWFRTEIGKHGFDASAATMDQIKGHFLPKLPMPALEGIAKLMGLR